MFEEMVDIAGGIEVMVRRCGPICEADRKVVTGEIENKEGSQLLRNETSFARSAVDLSLSVGDITAGKKDRHPVLRAFCISHH